VREPKTEAFATAFPNMVIITIFEKKS